MSDVSATQITKNPLYAATTMFDAPGLAAELGVRRVLVKAETRRCSCS